MRAGPVCCHLKARLQALDLFTLPVLNHEKKDVKRSEQVGFNDIPLQKKLVVETL